MAGTSLGVDSMGVKSMAPLWPLVVRALRRRPTQNVLIAVLVAIAAMLGNLALVLSTDYAANGDRVAAALHAEDVTALVRTAEGAEQARRFLADDARVGTVDVHQDLGGIATVAINGADSTVYGVFTPIDDVPPIGRSRIVEEHPTDVERPVWAPVTLAHNGYELGGPITLMFGGAEQTFHIQGWSETMFGSSVGMGQLTFLVPDTDGLADAPGIVPLWTVRALTHDPGQATAVSTDLSRHLADQAARLGLPTPLFYAMDMVTMQEVRTLTSDMFAVIMVAFALVVVAIAVLVIRFSVRTAIAGDLRSLGSLMAAGYTSGQVIATYALPFLALALAGGVLGIAASQLVLPAVADLLESQNGFTWQPGAPGGMALVTIGVLAAVTALSAVASAQPVRTLPPVQALRGGAETHVFRRNRLPLDATRGRLALLVGLKQAAHQPAQAVTVLLTTAVVAWAATMSMAVYANVLADTDRFIGVFMGELGDVEVGLARGADGAAVLSQVQAHPDVDRAIRVGIETASVGARDVYVRTTADFEQITNNQLYEGRMPRHDDEVAIGTGIVRTTGADIGDEVDVTVGSRTASYLVTGLMQGGTRAGHFAGMTDAGFTRLDPAYDLTMVRAYLAPGADRTAVVDDLTRELGADAALVRDQVEWGESTMGTYVSMSWTLAVALVVMTLVVVLVVTGLTVSGALTRERTRLGVLKAIGFTSGQLRWSLLAAHLPPVAAGAAVGVVIGGLTMNDALSLVLASTGIHRLESTLPVLPVVGLGALVIGVAATLIAAMSRTGRIDVTALAGE